MIFPYQPESPVTDEEGRAIGSAGDFRSFDLWRAKSAFASALRFRDSIWIRIRRADVLTAKSQSDGSSGNLTQDRELLQKLERQWKTSDGRLATQSRANEALVRENLKSLDHPRGKFAASLDFME